MGPRTLGLFILTIGIMAPTFAEESDSVERGKRALLGKSYTPAGWTKAGFEKLWQVWGLKEKPGTEEYIRLVQERYGLHSAPYPNHSYPMGFREAPLAIGTGIGLANDCLVCHGGSIAGKSYVGLGNASLDFQALFEEMNQADGKSKIRSTFQFTNVRGTNEAGAMSVFLIGYREPDLRLRFFPLNLDLQDDLCEDVPAWWLLKKKKTMYYTGGADTRSVRSLMQFMMSPFNGPGSFKEAEMDFADIRQYLLSLQAPIYPLPINRALAEQGKELFVENCSRCHGTYGSQPTYPNKIIPLEEIGTDRHRFDGIGKKFEEHYNRSWFAQGDTTVTPQGYPAINTNGYQAPPLDGIWATAPYLHNGSVPTVYHVLNSKARPGLFARSYRTGLEDYDSEKLGWKFKELDKVPDSGDLTPLERRKIYDTRKSGRGNQGHTYGDHLNEQERMAVIEYLKTF